MPSEAAPVRTLPLCQQEALGQLVPLYCVRYFGRASVRMLLTLAALHPPAPQVQHIMARCTVQPVIGQIAQARAPDAGRPAFGLKAPFLQGVATGAAMRLGFAHRFPPRAYSTGMTSAS